MTEPQVWTLIGVFSALMFGMFGVVSSLFVRVLRTEVAGLRSEMIGGIGSLRNEMVGEIGTLRGEVGGQIGALRADIHRLDGRLDNLDRDVQALMRHTFGIDRG